MTDPRNSLVVDVGANLGFFVMYAASMGCTVHAFEPQHRLLAHQRSSIMLNGFTKQITLTHALVKMDKPQSGAAVGYLVANEKNWGGAGFTHKTHASEGATIAQDRVSSKRASDERITRWRRV